MEHHPFHVPQESRGHKLRFIPQNDTVSSEYHHHHQQQQQQQQVTSGVPSALKLSLCTQARGGSSYSSTTPVGPFTGYASILGRSRFLRPAQELFEGLSVGGLTGKETETERETGAALVTKKILEESGSWFCEDDENEDVSRHCTNPNLLSMLHQVYKKYKLYCQQMQSAVSSFESVAGLANAAPFISFAVRAMFRHFNCLKNAILEQIRVTSKGSAGVDSRRERNSGSCPDDNTPYDHKQGHAPGSCSNLLQHPVWRSQRGFPDKAVAVLRTWLFDHFLHPYPSDSDKQMLAQKTGLSRSQVSNWFTNARVRLWKPMVEEMHALERKNQCSKSGDTSKFINLSSDNHNMVHPHLSERDLEAMNHRRERESQCKRTRIEEMARAEQNKEQFGLACSHLMPGNQMITGELNHSPARMASHQQNTSGLSWSPQGQLIPFWLARQ